MMDITSLIFENLAVYCRYAMMKVQAERCASRETAVGASRGNLCKSPLSERAVRTAGSYPLPYGQKRQNRSVLQFGWQHGSLFVPYEWGEKAFLSHRKLLRIDLAVLPHLNKHGAAIGEQLSVGVARFLTYRKLLQINLAVSPYFDTEKV